MSGTSHLLSPAKIAEVKRLAKKKLNNSAIPARPASRARRPELPAPVARQGVAHLDRGRALRLRGMMPEFQDEGYALA